MGTRRLLRLGLACAALAAPALAQEPGALRGRLALPRSVTLAPEERAASEIALDGRTVRVGLAPDLAFELAGIAPGAHELVVRVPEFEVLARTVHVHPGETLALELPLVLGIVLEGRVVDPHGERVPDVRVVVRSVSPARPVFEREVVVPHGTFRLAGIPAGELTLSARRDGYGRSALALGALPASAWRRELLLELEAFGTVAGLVLAPDGSPAANARVFLAAERSDRPRHAVVFTDPDGRFTFGGLGATTYHVAARASGASGEPWIATARGVAPGAELVLVLAPTGSVELVVRGLAPGEEAHMTTSDRAGRPADDGFEGVEEWRSLVRYASTATGGRIRGLEPGRYGLVASDADSTRCAWGLVDVRAGETTRVALELARATELVVRTFADGVEVVASVAIEAASGQRWLSGGTCIVDDDPGERALLPPGAYRVHVEREGRAGTAEVGVAGERERELRVELR